MTIVNDLRAILALLTTLGWRRGQEYYTKPGPLCLANALLEVTGGGERYTGALLAIAGQIGTEDLVNWNDAQGRTWDEVRAVLERAIRVAERSNASVGHGLAQRFAG